METVEEMDADVLKQLRRDGVVRWSYAAALRHVLRLATPGALVLLPIGVVALLCLIPPTGDALVVVDGRPQLVGASPVPMLVWGAAVLVAWAAGQMVVFPATVVLAAGVLTGRTVSVADAMRAAARRLPAMLVLAGVAVVVLVAILAAGLGMLAVTADAFPSIVVMVALAPLAVPIVLAVPAVVLEGRSAVRGIDRAYRLAARRFWKSVLTVVFGGWAIPALASWTADTAIPWIPGPAMPIVLGLAASALGLVVTPLQAAVSTGLFLHLLAIHFHEETDPEITGVLRGLPATRERPLRLVPVLAASLLPGLLYGATVLVNPLGWPEVRETVVTRSWRPGLVDGGRVRPHMGALRSEILWGLHAGPGSRVAVLIHDLDAPALLTCADPACDKPTYEYAEPNAHNFLAHATAATGLGDGRLAMTLWRRIGVKEPPAAQLELLICDARGCLPASEGTALVRPTGLGVDNSLMALAPRPGGGLVLATAEQEPAPEGGDSDRHLIRLVLCPDLTCARPSAKEIARTGTHGGSRRLNDFTVDVRPDGRPVVALLNGATGALDVLSCEDPACDRLRTAQPLAPGPERNSYQINRRPGLTTVVRPDGRPLIVYQDVDGAVRLLDCLTWDCTRTEAAALGGAVEQPAAPALVLDRSGRALVAFHDRVRDRITLATCEGIRCVSAPVSRTRDDTWTRLAITLDPRGRPMIAWGDGTGELHEGDWQLMLATVTRPCRCALPRPRPSQPAATGAPD
ncbi:hypothetical protein ETD86_16260 [Nonomuraea turkmeniaca]|uniref:Uncharacterized protein n=1 Tax=Nonomuraea turkmeniaca TaxID=103838 RepID=A0A5S4FK80_9ACTN|nr:hypothetical protein [Nonomuraea turkmeniaca]TMR21138.1 hypothetical protein ETD86_16260 [Nonomuraea turkmeniaca]